MKHKLLIALLTFALTACAGPGAMIVNADLDNATTLAKSVNDTEAATCFDALKKANVIGIIGVFAMLEQLRIVRMARTPCATVLLP